MVLSDTQVHRLLGELLAVPVEQRSGWLEGRIPEDIAFRSRILAAVSSVAGEDEAARAGPSPQRHDPDLPGQPPPRIGRYAILRQLGAGGMATVFLARDPAIDRLVAIKVLSAALDSSETRRRFEREARCAGSLQHRNIVTIFDIQEHDDRPCIVMEYVPGRTLFDLIAKREALSLAAKLSMIEALCDGLLYAHGAGVLHRDVKPSNVIVSDDGVTKILDFGIAHSISIAPGDPDSVVTAPGVVVGTAGYIAPEVWAGGPASPQSDVFSAAVVAFELLTYCKPFGEVLAHVPRRMLAGEVSPMHVDGAAVPGVLEQAILKGLAAPPDSRFADAAAMKRALRSIRKSL